MISFHGCAHFVVAAFPFALRMIGSDMVASLDSTVAKVAVLHRLPVRSACLNLMVLMLSDCLERRLDLTMRLSVPPSSTATPSTELNC